MGRLAVHRGVVDAEEYVLMTLFRAVLASFSQIPSGCSYGSSVLEPGAYLN